MTDDEQIAHDLEDAAWDALDQQGMDDGVELYVDTIAGYVEGRPNVPALILAVLEAYWAENGR